MGLNPPSRNNWYSLATRGLIELSVYLTQTYEYQSGSEGGDDDDDAQPERRAIKKCEACSDLLTIGQRCDDLRCEVRMHHPCAAQYFAHGRGMNCPKCKTPWTGRQQVGEAAAVHLRKRIRRSSTTNRAVDASAHKKRKTSRTRPKTELEEADPAPDSGGDGDGDRQESHHDYSG